MAFEHIQELWSKRRSYKMNDYDATEWAFVFDRVMHECDVTNERVTHRKEMTTKGTFEPEIF